MQRRSFFKKSLPAVTLLPGTINGMALQVFSPDSQLMQSLLSPQTDTDHVLVIVQLAGGNDGLNTVIPRTSYSNYYNARTNIAIPEQRILGLNGYNQAGLHPAMTGLHTMYNEGKLGIVQAVGYPMPNFSHFRATDIWMSASDSNQVLNTGWGGRYLDLEYPGYPNGYPSATHPDPLAIQIGSITSFTCQGPAVTMGMSITDPESFYNLINGVEDPAPNNYMGHELTYIRETMKQTNKYSQRVVGAATRVTQQKTYPANNTLAEQLKIVARLIKGGLQTRIYMVSYGGFDTHSLQTTTTDTTTGLHANLLFNFSNAIKAFQDDLKFLGIEDKVIGMTYSEFGRRIKSNASGGTDHGAAAPVFLFGTNVTNTVTGNNPAIPAGATVNDNIPYQYDFRSVYASVLQKWFCLKDADLQMVMLKNYQQLPVINDKGCRVSTPAENDKQLVKIYPNPFVESTTIQFGVRGGHASLQIMNGSGQVIKTLVDKEFAPGTYTTPFNGYGLPTGVYYARLQNGPVQEVGSMLKVR